MQIVKSAEDFYEPAHAAVYEALLELYNQVQSIDMVQLTQKLADKDMLDEAIETAKRLIALTPDDAMGFTILSRFYQQKGLIPEAEAEAAKARVLDWKRELQEKKLGQGS